MRIFSAPDVSAWSHCFTTAGFYFLLATNTLMLAFYCLSQLSLSQAPRTSFYHQVESSQNVYDSAASPEGRLYDYLGQVPRVFFADLLRQYEQPVNDDGHGSNLLDEANFPYSQKFIYVKEPSKENLTVMGVSMIH